MTLVYIEYLFLLDELFKKNKLQNIFPKKLSDSLKDIGIENIPENYKEVAEARIMSEQEINLGKVKYNILLKIMLLLCIITIFSYFSLENPKV